MRGNREATSASTTALSTIAPRWAACVSCSCDHDSQRGSSVKRSSRTLLSTNVSKLNRSPAGQSEDLLGAHLALAGTAHATDLLGGSGGVDEQARAMIVELELDVAARLDAKRPPHRQRDRDLTLLRDPHAVRLASNTMGGPAGAVIYSLGDVRADRGSMSDSEDRARMSAPTVVVLAAGQGTRMRSDVAEVGDELCGVPVGLWPGR